MNKFKQYIRLYLIGLGMGTADLIPGVSGGTIAFLAGIYEELIRSIKIATGDVVKQIFKLKFKKAFHLIPFEFLLPLLFGIGSAILLLANIFSYLLKEQAVFVWSFFMGLVAVSVFIVSKRINKWGISKYTGFLLSSIFAFYLVGLVPGKTPETLLYFFLSGMVAICAMILPGISGSFILLLLGKYEQVLDALLRLDMTILSVFILGTIAGLTLFSRLLSWLFKNYHDISVAILAGFMLGSIRKIWPWKETISTTIDRHGEVVPLIEQNVLPDKFDINFFIAIILLIGGGVIIYFLDRIEVIKNKTNKKSSS